MLQRIVQKSLVFSNVIYYTASYRKNDAQKISFLINRYVQYKIILEHTEEVQ